MGGKRDDGGGGVITIAVSYGFCCAETVKTRHPDIHEDQAKILFAGQEEGFKAILGTDDVVSKTSDH